MRLTLAVSILLALSSIPAAAQDERIGIGGSVTYVNPRSEELTRSPLTVRPLIRLQPGEGWGLAGAFNWYDTDVDGAFAGVNGELGELQTKPFMGGVGYTLRHGRVRTTFSIVGGPAWNRLKIRDDVREAFQAAGRDIDDTIDVASLAIRPGAGVSVRVAPRLDLTGFGGYLFNRPKFTIPTPSGDVENDWNGDAVVLSVGMVVAIF
jgi:hypothetical protein